MLEAPAQAGTKLSLTVRVGLSRFGSRSAIDCHVPSWSRPSTTGIVKEGGAELVAQLEDRGYGWIREEVEAAAAAAS